MKKRMAILLTVFLLLGMTACGGESSDSSEVDSTSDSVTSDTSVDANTTTSIPKDAMSLVSNKTLAQWLNRQ